MKVLIIEDESRAANHLARLIGEVAPEMEIISKIESVMEAVRFLQTNPNLDLIFSDIQLADGLSFEIYNQVEIRCPIVFTTAYDKYAIEAFNTNGIDYLLKPIEQDRLKQAIHKVKSLKSGVDMFSLLQQANLVPKTKSRFMVKVGEKIKSIVVDDIKLFYSQDKASFLHSNSDRIYAIDYSLDELQQMLSEDVFFKINRKYLVSFNCCNNIVTYSNSRLKLKINGVDDDQIIVARERVQDFKRWLDH